jgi:hypothetical protein
MRPNPLHDTVQFLVQTGWFTQVFRLLLLGSISIAVLVWRCDPAQRTPRAVALSFAADVGRHHVVAADASENPAELRRATLLDGTGGSARQCRASKRIRGLPM